MKRAVVLLVVGIVAVGAYLYLQERLVYGEDGGR